MKIWIKISSCLDASYQNIILQTIFEQLCLFLKFFAWWNLVANTHDEFIERVMLSYCSIHCDQIFLFWAQYISSTSTEFVQLLPKFTTKDLANESIDIFQNSAFLETTYNLITAFCGKYNKFFYFQVPSKEITGGIWYTSNEFDHEFIEVLRNFVTTVVRENRKEGITLKSITERVRTSGIRSDLYMLQWI